MKTKLLALSLLCFSALGVDFSKLISARTVAVINTSTTNIQCPLEGATVIQVYIRPSSTAQVFTVTLTDTSTIEVPSGATFTLRSATSLKVNEVCFSVQTATGSANLQVVGIKESK